jgi:membrane associated rhomboid family serine protease
MPPIGRFHFRRNIMNTPMTAALFVAVFLFMSALDGPLYAYLDPGTGSIVLQAVIAGAVGAIALARLYWHKLRSVVRPAGNRPRQ